MRPVHSLLLSLACTTALAETEPGFRCGLDTPQTYSTGYVFTFKAGLNYDYVYSDGRPAVQICRYGGAMVDYALGGTGSIEGSIQTWRIEPVDLSATRGYVASAMVVRAPSGFLDELNNQLGNSSARLYNHPDLLERQMAEQIDDSFEITVGKLCCMAYPAFVEITWLRQRQQKNLYDLARLAGARRPQERGR